MPDIQAKFGNLFEHAEAMQKNAQEQQTLAAQLLASVQERIRQLEALNERLSERVASFNELPKKLGVLAYKGGEASVAQALRSELDGLSATITKTTKEALTSAISPLKEKTSDALKAADLLSFQAKRFSLKTLGVIGASALCALVIVLLATWVSLAWQRTEVESMKAEKAVISSEIEDMKANAERLKELGGKIEISGCIDSETKKSRKCVAIQPTPKAWGTTEKPFYILKGY